MIGTRIRYYRKRAGLTLEQLADGICSVSYLSKFEHGEGASDEIVQLLCKRLGISFEDVDNKEELSHINRLLDEWYEEIKDRDMEKAQDTRKTISGLLKKNEDPYTVIKYDLLFFRLNIVSNQLEKAEQQEQFLKKMKDIMDNELKYYFYHFMGIYYYNKQDYLESIKNYTLAEELIDNTKHNDSEEAELYYQISLTHAFFYQINLCISYANKALVIFDKDYNLKRISDCHTLLGVSNRRTSNFPQAKYHYEQSLKFAKLYKDDERIGIIYHNLGCLEAESGDFKKGINYLKLSLELKSNSINRSLACLAIGYFLLKTDDRQNTLHYINHGIKIAQENDVEDILLELNALKLKTENNSDYSKYVKNEVLPYFKKHLRWNLVTEYAEGLANYYFDIGQYKKASQFYRLANEARKKIK